MNRIINNGVFFTEKYFVSYEDGREEQMYENKETITISGLMKKYEEEF